MVMTQEKKFGLDESLDSLYPHLSLRDRNYERKYTHAIGKSNEVFFIAMITKCRCNSYFRQRLSKSCSLRKTQKNVIFLFLCCVNSRSFK